MYRYGITSERGVRDSRKLENSYKDIWAKTILGTAKVHISANEDLKAILAEKERVIEEKERTIQILMASAGISIPGRERDSNDKKTTAK